MSTLLVFHLGSKGAGPRMLHDFAEAAAADRRRRVVLAYYGGCELAPDLHALGLPELVAPPCARRADRVLSNAGMALALLRFARRHQVTEAYAVMDNPLQLLPTALLRLSGVPVLGSAHDADRHAGEESRIMVAAMGLRPHAYTGLMTYSSSVATLMRERVRRPELIFETVHGSYGTRRPEPAPRAAAPSPAVVGFFGRILRYKGIDRLADAVALLRAEGRAVELRVHGRGRITADLDDRLRRAGAVVDNRWIDEADVADLVASFDVVAIPYSEASQSGVVGYAMNAGVPVVTTPHPGLLEQVVAPGVGIAARDLTPAAFAAALAEVIDDDSLYARLSTQGPIAARTQFGWDQVVDDVLQATAALRARQRRGQPAAERALPVRSHRGDVS